MAQVESGYSRTLQEEKKQQQNIILIIILLVVIAILGYVIFNLNFVKDLSPKKTLKYPSAITSPTIAVYKPPEKVAVDSCLVKKEENPLVSATSILIEKGAEYTSIIYKGTATKVEVVKVVKNEIKGVKVTLESADKKQSFPFQILDKENLVYDTRANAFAALSDLKVGQNITIQVKCPKNTMDFNIASVVIR